MTSLLFSAVIALFFGLITFAVTLISGGDLLFPTIFAFSAAFFASLLLISRDSFARRRESRKIRRFLKGRHPLSGDDFRSHFLFDDQVYADRLRHSLASFFSVEPERIYPDDNFSTYGDIDQFSPDLWFYLLQSVGVDDDLIENLSFDLPDHKDLSFLWLIRTVRKN